MLSNLCFCYNSSFHYNNLLLFVDNVQVFAFQSRLLHICCMVERESMSIAYVEITYMRINSNDTNR